MIYRAIKIRLYPNQKQLVSMNKTLGCYRFVYNQMLARKINAYKEDGTNLGLCKLSKFFYGELRYNENYPWLLEQNTQVMNQAIQQMLVAFKNHFEGRGYPRFKRKSDAQAAHFPKNAISKKNDFEEKKITLTSALIGVKFRCSKMMFERLQRYKDHIKSATLSKTKTRKYYLSVLIEMEESELARFQHTGKNVGIDLGVKDFVITSDGERFENKHLSKEEKRKIAKLSKQLSKKQKGSSNREKARLKLAKVHEKIANRRNDYLHQIVNALLGKYDTVIMEDLNVSGMLKNHKLAYAIQELGLYSFKVLLKDKAALNGKTVFEIDRFFPSSQLCSQCGYRYRKLRLSERQWHCPQCGRDLDRDVNAAMNILREGERNIGTRSAELTLVDCPTVDDRSACKSLRSCDRMKQEVKF
jgi:putative transposase